MIPRVPEWAGKSVFLLFIAIAPPLIFGANSSFLPLDGRVPSCMNFFMLVWLNWSK